MLRIMWVSAFGLGLTTYGRLAMVRENPKGVINYFKTRTLTLKLNWGLGEVDDINSFFFFLNNCNEVLLGFVW